MPIVAVIASELLHMQTNTHTHTHTPHTHTQTHTHKDVMDKLI